MKWKGYLIAKKGQRDMAVRITKITPSLARNEIAIHLEIELPDALFDTPQLQARIDIPEELVPHMQIDARMQNNITEAIRRTTELDVVLNVVKPKDDSK